ncbi:MAG: PQQ-binding-like beta-propeller repeat protein, partial [Thermoplasmata archaeon]|nr:PQQ-binding-like beta-propeller repeat protein [Thermoplasmata archaeon]
VTSGEKVWNFTTKGTISSSPAVADGKIFFGSSDHRVYALYEATGELCWNYTTRGSVSSSPAYHNHTLFVGSDDHKLYALHTGNGTKKWEFLTGGQVKTSPALAYGKVYIGSTDTYLYCLEEGNGSEVWKKNLTTQGGYSSAAVADNKVYIGTEGGRLYALNAGDGSMLWYYNASGYQPRICPSPSIGQNKKLYFGIGSALYCFGKNNTLPYLNFSSLHKDGESVLISWSAGDGDGDPITLDLYYDQDLNPEEGLILIENDLENLGYHSWDVSNLPEGTYYLYGVVKDGYDENISYSTGIFISHPAPPIPDYSIRVLSPKEEEGVKGGFTIRFDLGDDISVAKVYLEGKGIGDELLWEGWERPFEFNWDTTEYRHGEYTIRVVGYALYLANATPVKVNETSVKVLIENEHVPLMSLAAGSVSGGAVGAGVSFLLTKRGGRFRLKGIKSSTKKRKKVGDNPMVTMASVLVALMALVLAYTYSRVTSPPNPSEYLEKSWDPLEVFASLPSTLMDRLPLMIEVMVYVSLAIGAVLFVRLIVDAISTRRYDMDSAFRIQLPGLLSLGLTTILFAVPFGYPGKSVHEAPEGMEDSYRQREGKVALARILGTLTLLTPFYLIREDAYLLTELGIMIVLMTVFFLSLPLSNYEGKYLFRWNKGIWFLILLVNAVLFYGWQLLFISDEVLLLAGIGGLLGLAAALSGKKHKAMA